MIAQCDECKRFYKNTRTMKEHQRQTGHKQPNIDGNIARLSDVAKLHTELYDKSKLIAKLDDSLKVKDEVIATLHDELDRVTKPEYQQSLIRKQLSEHLHRMSREAYGKLGEELGFLDGDKIDSKIGKIEGKTSLHDEPSALIGKEECAETEGEKFWRELNEALKKEHGSSRS